MRWDDLNEVSAFLGHTVSGTIDYIDEDIAGLQNRRRVINEFWAEGDWESLAEMGVVDKGWVEEFRKLEKKYGLS